MARRKKEAKIYRQRPRILETWIVVIYKLWDSLILRAKRWRSMDDVNACFKYMNKSYQNYEGEQFLNPRP